MAPFEAGSSCRRACQAHPRLLSCSMLTLPPTSAGGREFPPLGERDQRFQEGLWPGSPSEFVPSLLGGLAGLGAWWALPFVTSVHLARHVAPFSGILHLREPVSLLLALTGFCSRAAHPLSPSSTEHTWAGSMSADGSSLRPEGSLPA